MFSKEELSYIRELLKEDQSENALSIISKIDVLMKETGMCIWKFYWDCGRSGDVEGFFRATKEEVESAIGMNVYFGEILGKHSEVEGVLEEGDLRLISDDAVIVNTYNTSGYNPLEYIMYKCEECGDSYETYEMYSTSKDNCICEYCYKEKSNK